MRCGAIYYWQARSIEGFLHQLKAECPHITVEDYVSFYSLYNHQFLDEQTVVSTDIYVHSKLLIVDDNRLFIGSANVNDRSLMGRDTEIGLVIWEDNDKVKTHQPLLT